jgi:hypothetical protein
MCEECQDFFDNCPKLKYILQRLHREEPKGRAWKMEPGEDKPFAHTVWDGAYNDYFANFYETSYSSDDDSDLEFDRKRKAQLSKPSVDANESTPISQPPIVSGAESASASSRPRSKPQRPPKKVYPKWYEPPSCIWVHLPDKLQDDFAAFDDNKEFDKLWIARDLENERRRKGSKTVDPTIWVIPEKFATLEAYLPPFEEYVPKPRKKKINNSSIDGALSTTSESSKANAAITSPATKRTTIAGEADDFPRKMRRIEDGIHDGVV